jgi:hypothetical protein
MNGDKIKAELELRAEALTTVIRANESHKKGYSDAALLERQRRLRSVLRAYESILAWIESNSEKPCDYCGNHPALTGPDSYGACENCKLGHDENFPDGGELSVGGFDTSNQDLNVPELVTGLEASGLNVITIDEDTDFSKLPSLGELLGRKEK